MTHLNDDVKSSTLDHREFFISSSPHAQCRRRYCSDELKGSVTMMEFRLVVILFSVTPIDPLPNFNLVVREILVRSKPPTNRPKTKWESSYHYILRLGPLQQRKRSSSSSRRTPFLFLFQRVRPPSGTGAFPFLDLSLRRASRRECLPRPVNASFRSTRVHGLPTSKRPLIWNMRCSKDNKVQVDKGVVLSLVAKWIDWRDNFRGMSHSTFHF